MTPFFLPGSCTREHKLSAFVALSHSLLCLGVGGDTKAGKIQRDKDIGVIGNSHERTLSRGRRGSKSPAFRSRGRGETSGHSLTSRAPSIHLLSPLSFPNLGCPGAAFGTDVENKEKS